MRFLEVAKILAENEISFGVEFEGCNSYSLEISLNEYNLEVRARGRDFYVDVNYTQPNGRGYFQATIPESDFEKTITQFASGEFNYPIELMFNSTISKDRFWEIIEQNPNLTAVVNANRRVGFFKDNLEDWNLVAEIEVED